MGARQLRPGQLRTGSLFDITSSFAISASYAKNAATASYALNAVPFPFSGSAVVTGSLEIKSDRNNIFIIKNFNEQNILTVSQSGVVTLATHSVELTSAAPVGGIYFTATSLFIGLE
jgi:hypothetical protein